MEIKKENKLKNFVKKFGVYGLIGVFVVAVALAVGLTAGTQEEVEVATNVLTFELPMNEATVSKDFSSTELQYNAVLNRWEIHLGVDLTSQDASVFSVLDGTVTDVYSNSLEGNVIEITHSDGFVSVYSSLDDDVLVEIGNTVEKGQQIGSASNTAGSETTDDAQLHFVLYLNGVEVDPNDYLDLQLK